MRWLLVVVGLVALIYGAHVRNEFHFDDSHTIVTNPNVREVRNIPRFFTDPNLGSVLPENRVYRPVLFAWIVVEYWLGRGLNPVWFHVPILAWFLVEIVLIFVLARRVVGDPWAACFAASVYGLHPVMAETVNYIIQQGELLATVGVLAGLVVYIERPASRRFGLYLVPAGLGMLSKQPALVFPLLLFLYLWLIEEEQPVRALVHVAPAIALTIAVGLLSLRMTPAGFNPAAAGTAFGYRITQPLVLLRHFSKFFVPTGTLGRHGPSGSNQPVGRWRNSGRVVCNRADRSGSLVCPAQQNEASGLRPGLVPGGIATDLGLRHAPRRDRGAGHRRLPLGFAPRRLRRPAAASRRRGSRRRRRGTRPPLGRS